MFEILVERELPRPRGEDDPMARLWSFWDRERDGARVLPRARFDAFAFPELLGRINLVTIEPGRPTRFCFRVFGSGMDDPLQGDMTARSVADIREPAYADLVQRHYLQAFRLCRPCFAEIKSDIGEGNLFHYCRLILPLSTKQDICDMLLVTSVRYADDRNWAPQDGISLSLQKAHRYDGTVPERVHKF
jgi:hypothetical protein